MKIWNDIHYINYMGEPAMIEVTFIDEDEIHWQVIDIDTGHLRLLNKLLHDDGKHQGAIEILLLADVEKLRNEYELDQRLKTNI